MRYTSFSVHQVQARKGKPWQAKLNYKDPITGKRKQLSKYMEGATGKREAQRLAQEWMDEMNKKAEEINAPETSMTVSDVVWKHLKYQLTTGALEQSTYDKQEYNFAKYVEPYLGQYIFKDLDRVAIMDWHTTLSAMGYAQSTIHNAYAIINKVYDYYASIEEIPKNPFDTVRVPFVKGIRVTHMTAKQMERFVVAMYATFEPKDAKYAGFFLPFYAPLRRGEVCGLRWRDIDFERNLITVSSAIGMKNGGTYTKQPKNKASARTFPMVPQLSKILKERYDAIHPEPNWFVVGNEEEHWNPTGLGNAFRKFCEENELVDAYGKTLHLHALRHNFATVGMRSNIDLSALSLMLGHTNRATTLDIYGDANEHSKLLAAEQLGKTFKKEADMKIEYDEELDAMPAPEQS